MLLFAGMVVWHPVTLECRLVISGGRVPKKEYAIESTNVSEQIFVRVEKNQEWLRKMVVGPEARKGALSRTRLVETLREKSNRGNTAVAECDDRESSTAAADPMAALVSFQAAVVDAAEDHPPAKKARTSRKTKLTPSSSRCMDVEMPAAFTAKNLSSIETRTVRLFRKARNSLFISQDDVPWMLEYLRDEADGGGVAELPDDEDSQHLERNSAVADLHLRWAFDGSWEGTWLSGPRQNQSVKSYVKKLTNAKWDSLCEAAPDAWSGTYEQSTYARKKQATRHFLELHMRDAAVADTTELADADGEGERHRASDSDGDGGADHSGSDVE